MAIRRRRPAAKAAQAPTSRVHAVSTAEQFWSMMDKAAAAKRLVVVQLYQAQNYTCAQMRAYYRRMSVDAALKAAVFLEVEVDGAEDELLAECGMRDGAAKIPCYRCYVAGEEVESYAGGIPAEVAKMVARQLAQLRGSGGGLLAKLLLAAAAAGAAAAAAYLRFGRPQGGSQARDLGAEMRSLADRINIAQQRLRNAERAGRLKAAKNQRRILQQLQAQQAAVEQQLSKRRQPGGGGGGGPAGARRRSQDATAGSGGEQPEQGRQQRRRRRVAWKTEEYTTDEDEPPRRYRPAVLYSDEEE